MASKKAQSGPSKARNFAFIMYPESMPDDWEKILGDWHIKILISPLHDADVNADESEKKPHYHVIIIFDGPATAARAQAVADSVCGTIILPVASLRSYARYLCHMDNPEKAQYDVCEVRCMGQVDYLDIVASAADVDAIITEMEQWCDENGVFSYAQLCRYARNEKPQWARILRHRCTVHMKAYLQSCQWEFDHNVLNTPWMKK